MKWTKEQESAIYTKDCNLLVAAGAGSGKTAVLVERIINKIVNEKIDIDRLLVVTFTNAAASEMRERIADSLYKIQETNPEVQKQIMLLNKASITTLHSFCLRVIRDNFFKEDLDPNFRIGDSTECELLKIDAMEDVLEDIYAEESDRYEELISIYTDSKEDTLLRDTILNIYKFIQSSPFPFEWLTEKCEMYNIDSDIDFSKTMWGEYLLNYAKEEIDGSINEIKEVIEEIFDCPEAQNYILTLQEDVLNLKALQKVSTWDDMYNQISLLNFGTLKQARTAPEDVKELVKDVRDKVKKNIKTYLKENVFVSSSKEIIEDLKLSYKNLKLLSELVEKFDKAFKNKKREKNIVDFNDIEHICLKLLTENEDIRNMYKEKYDEILIDEYQDSNLIQEYIVNMISNNKTFMVGDVKQSIYRFRQARPELFLNKYNTYAEDDNSSPNQKILLFKNFRSNKNIIDATNYIFSEIMSSEIGEIEYTEKEYLGFGAEYYPKLGDNVEINLIENKMAVEEIDYEDDDINEKPQLEGKVIASKILDIVGKLDVYDKHTENTRKAEYKDIVILLRATTRYSDCFMEELSKKGIPVFCDSSLGYFETTELQIVISLLKIIDNPIQDIPLLAVLRSPICNFTADELVNIRLVDRNVPLYNAMQKAMSQLGDELSNKIKEFLDRLSEWRNQSKYLPLNELIWKLYQDTGYYYYVSLLPDGLKRQANLKLLIERAESYERTSYKGLFNFINYIENIKTSNNDMESSKIIGENENVVRIMSIHKSKGLEFPVVFLAGTSRKFNMRDFQDKIVLHQDFGFGTDIIKYDKRIQYPSIPKLALIQKAKIETLSEEMRILYVAMTRAREKLIITAMTPNIEKTYEKLAKEISKYRIKKATSLFDWIGLATFEKKCEFEIKAWSYLDVLSIDNQTVEKYDTLITNIENNFVKDENYESISKILSWKYPYMQATTLPTKISISEIKSRLAGKEDNLEEIIEKPNFMESDVTSGASYGTVVHSILQALDFENPDLEKACVNIDVDEKTKNIAKKQINELIKSDLFKRIQNSKKVKRETSFNLNIPVNSVYDVEETVNEKIMIQGIIDLYFIENNEIVLVDYKTDKVKNEEELIKKYAIQLKYYKQALEEIIGLSVKESIIYSLNLNKEIHLE